MKVGAAVIVPQVIPGLRVRVRLGSGPGRLRNSVWSLPSVLHDRIKVGIVTFSNRLPGQLSLSHRDWPRAGGPTGPGLPGIAAVTVQCPGRGPAQLLRHVHRLGRHLKPDSEMCPSRGKTEAGPGDGSRGKNGQRCQCVVEIFAPP